MKKLTWFLFYLLFAVSCLDEPECYLLNNNFAGVYFRVMGSNVADSIPLRRVLINGAPLASSRTGIFDRTKDSLITNIQVPLDFFSTSTSLEFSNAKDIFNVLAGYRVQAQYVSEECGPRYILSNLGVLQKDFDSVRVVNTNPNRSTDGRHIEIFRCPAPDTLQLTLYQLTLPPAGTVPTASSRRRALGADIAAVTTDNGVIMHENARKTTLRLPVNVNANSTTYTFDFADDFGLDEPQRELVVDYTRTTEQRYRFCGTQTFITALDVASSTFDSVAVNTDTDGFILNSITDPPTTNINIYRCPPTNIVQIAFRSTVSAISVDLVRITADFTDEVYYENTSASIVRLPLNPTTNSTTFTIEYEGRTETVTVEYSRIPVASTIFDGACSDLNTFENLSIGGGATNITVVNDAIVFPSVTNINIEVPQ